MEVALCSDLILGDTVHQVKPNYVNSLKVRDPQTWLQMPLSHPSKPSLFLFLVSVLLEGNLQLFRCEANVNNRQDALPLLLQNESLVRYFTLYGIKTRNLFESIQVLNEII